MGTIVIQQKLTKAEAKKACVEAIVKIGRWFTANPRRRVCHAQIWYVRETFDVPRKEYKAFIEDELQRHIRNGDFR